MKTALTTFALAVSAFAAQAGTFDNWARNGSAQLLDAGDTLRLTDSNGYQAGSAWLTDKVSLAHDFSVAFSFRIAGGTAADGLTFTVQDNAAGKAAIGGNGGLLGYGGIGQSVAFTYDTFDNGWDSDRLPGANTSVAVNGDFNAWSGATVGTAYELRDKVVYSWIDYSAATQSYSMYISDTAAKPLSAQETFDGSAFSLSGSAGAFIGFTAATGGATDNHDILGLSITAVSAVPEADALALMLFGLPFAVAVVRRHRA